MSDAHKDLLTLVGVCFAGLAAAAAIAKLLVPANAHPVVKASPILLTCIGLVLFGLWTYHRPPFGAGERHTSSQAEAPTQQMVGEAATGCREAINSADVSTNSDDWQHAKEQCEYWVSAAPTSGDPYFWRGYAKDHLGLNCEAISDYEAARAKGIAPDLDTLAKTEAEALRQIGTCP